MGVLSKIKKKGISGLFRAINTKLKYLYYKPKININSTYKTISLGYNEGEKIFIDTPNLKNSVIVSCGLGEDASFDIEFAKKYNATVVILDPTPRAISHYNDIIENINSDNPNRVIENNNLKRVYDLSNVSRKQLILEKYALWIENTTLNFYLPINKKNVSHSIVNFQNDYKSGDEFEHIKVKAITLNDLMRQYEINQLELLKLDIEGAEVQVIEKMLDDKIYPNQICVEFDGLNAPSKRAKSDFERVDKKLRSIGYDLIYYDGVADFTYLFNNKK